MAEPYKKKIEQEDDILEDGDFVLDGYTVNIEDTTKFNDDLSLDHNDYEHIQEEYGIQSEDVQPIALDRFIERIGKSRRSPR
tara:strand:+ start:360 stop:605 length:246 start_codon:yes stop_codon:yes gene_type:complete